MRLRSRISPLRIRYFACGEYGGYRFGSLDATREINPHYHLALYGLNYQDADLISETWGLGLVDVKFLEPASALYLAKYVTKKMTGKEDERLQITEDFRLHPEFQRQSLKPGLGAGVMSVLAKGYENPYALATLDIEGDVPKSITYGGKYVPLGRYLKKQLRKALGFENVDAQKDWALKKSMHQLQNLQEIQAKAEEMGVNTYQYKSDIIKMKRSRILEKIKINKDKL
jgi:hypothetical protein